MLVGSLVMTELARLRLDGGGKAWLVSLRGTLLERARTVTHHSYRDNEGHVPFRFFADPSSFVPNTHQTLETCTTRSKTLTDGLTRAALRIVRSGDTYTK